MIRVAFDSSAATYVLRGMSRNIQDLTPAWNKVHDVFLRFEEEVFKSEGAYAMRKWKPLSRAYAESKRRRFGVLPILRLRGTLMRSLTRRSNDLHVKRITPRSAEFGTRDPVARWHQDGTGSRRGGARPPRITRTPRMGRASFRRAGQFAGMPPRPPIPPFTRAEGERIADIMLAHVINVGRR